jgi:hypothetical protein
LNRKIRAPTQSKLPTSTTPKDIGSDALSLSLSKLLSQAQSIADDLKLVKLIIVEQPRELWKKRSINCLKNNWCPAIQGQSGTQRRGIVIKVRVQINYLTNLYDFLFNLYPVVKTN